MAVSLRVNKDIVFMTFSGDVSKQEAIDPRLEASKHHRQGIARGFLVDVRNAQIHMSTIELYDFFTTLQEMFAPGTKHAVVYSPETNDLSDIAFGENVSANRGIMLKMFSQKDEAMTWLSNENST